MQPIKFQHAMLKYNHRPTTICYQPVISHKIKKCRSVFKESVRYDWNKSLKSKFPVLCF